MALIHKHTGRRRVERETKKFPSNITIFHKVPGSGILHLRERRGKMEKYMLTVPICVLSPLIKCYQVPYKWLSA
jgi:hypothetical protein